MQDVLALLKNGCRSTGPGYWRRTGHQEIKKWEEICIVYQQLEKQQANSKILALQTLQTVFARGLKVNPNGQYECVQPHGTIKTRLRKLKANERGEVWANRGNLEFLGACLYFTSTGWWKQFGWCPGTRYYKRSATGVNHGNSGIAGKAKITKKHFLEVFARWLQSLEKNYGGGVTRNSFLQWD